MIKYIDSEKRECHINAKKILHFRREHSTLYIEADGQSWIFYCISGAEAKRVEQAVVEANS